MTAIANVLARSLISMGAVADFIEPDGLEILAPPEVQEALSIPELSRIGFGPELPENARRVSLESDWVEKIAGIFDRGARVSSVFVSDPAVPAARQMMDKLLPQAFVLDNATLRILETEPAWASYFVPAFRITAISDEKREDLVLLSLNESTGALADAMVNPLVARLQEWLDSRVAWKWDAAPEAAWPAQRIHEHFGSILPSMVRARLVPFISGMERRMARDLDRLHSYYGDLHAQHQARLNQKAGKADDAALQRETTRLEAVVREYHAKVADLQRKYAVTADVRFLQALRVNLPVQRVHFSILRRKGRRNAYLDWNPLARRLDSPGCESCRAPAGIYSICDEKLHWLCPACTAPCASCGKNWCRACGSACPRCR